MYRVGCIACVGGVITIDSGRFGWSSWLMAHLACVGDDYYEPYRADRTDLTIQG